MLVANKLTMNLLTINRINKKILIIIYSSNKMTLKLMNRSLMRVKKKKQKKLLNLSVRIITQLQ